MPAYDEKYVKTKVKEFKDVVNTNFWGDKVPKEVVHHTCIACKYQFCYENGKKIIHKFI